MPWRSLEGRVEVLVTDPSGLNVADDLSFALGCEVRAIAAPVGVRREVEGHVRPSVAMKVESEPDSAETLQARSAEAPVVALVDALLARAVRERASDLHLEPYADRFRIRLRTDGVLYELPDPPADQAPAIISRLKVLANLDIAERRLPQDGRIRFSTPDRQVDLRLSTLPTRWGESTVIRILDPANAHRDLGELGLAPMVRSQVEDAILQPHGLVLVTGPTGAGKTSTLYAALRSLNVPEAKLVSVEDPVEFQIDGVMQVAVNPTAGMGFAAALRALLRQDPDAIMIGEIRDPETAAIAVQAALTGHLVLSSLHTIDAAGAVARLVDLGVAPYLIASAVEGILAQRLVRRLCPSCRELVVPSRADDSAAVSFRQFRRCFRARGCPECEGSGFRGRIGVFEWLRATETWRDRVGSETGAANLRRWLADSGHRNLRDELLRLVEEGETTPEEALRWLDPV